MNNKLEIMECPCCGKRLKKPKNSSLPICCHENSSKINKDKPCEMKSLGFVKKEFLKDSDYHTTCPFKGLASYYDVVVGGEVNKDAAWYYPTPKQGYEKIKDYIAFWHGIEVK